MRKSKYIPALLAAVLSMTGAAKAEIITDQSLIKIWAPMSPGLDRVVLPSHRQMLVY